MKNDQYPLVSVIIPSYNCERYIEESIKSVLDQSYKNIECIIIDGGSNDGTTEIIKKYSNNLKYWISENDKGQSEAINKGFKICAGDLIGWLGADDILEKDAVENVVDSFLDNRNAGVFYGKIKIINNESKIINTIRLPDIDFYKLLNNNSVVVQPGSFCNIKYLDKGYFVDERYHFCMDLELWFRISKNHEIVFVDEFLASFRLHEVSKSGRGDIGFLKERIQITKEYGRKLFSSSTFYLVFQIVKRKIKIILK